MKYKSVSIYTMWAYVSKFLFLLIIPFIKSLILQPTGIKEFIKTMWTSILAILIIIIFSFIEYKSIKYMMYDDILIIRKGFIIKKKLIIPIKNINAIVSRCTLLLNLFKSEKISICINSEGEKRKKLVDLIIKKSDLDNNLNIAGKIETFKISPIKILLMSMSWSNPVVSLLIAVPFINKMASIIGEETTKRLYSTVGSVFNFITIGIPPLIASISYIMLGAFFITSVIHLLTFVNFKTQITSEYIITTSGLISENTKIIKKHKISAIIINQNLIMLILKLYSMYVHVLGISQGKGEYNLLFTASKKEDIHSVIAAIYNNDSSNKFCIKPHKNRAFNFLKAPLCSLIILFSVIITFFGDKWYEKVILLTLLFILILILWWIAICYFAYKHSSLSFSENLLYLNGFKRLSLYRAVIPICNIQSISIMKNPFFKWSNLCTVKIIPFSGEKYKFKCKYLNYDEVGFLIESNK